MAMAMAMAMAAQEQNLQQGSFVLDQSKPNFDEKNHRYSVTSPYPGGFRFYRNCGKYP